MSFDYKALLIGILIAVAVIYGGPPAGRVVGLIAPIVVNKAASVVEPAPPSSVPGALRVSSPLRNKIYKATLEQVAHDFGIKGRLDCRVVTR